MAETVSDDKKVAVLERAMVELLEIGKSCQYVFSTSAGPVTLSFRKGMTTGDVEDLRSLFDVVIRRLEREASVASVEAGEQDGSAG